ncbi:hypothetical protein LCGC14_0224210 [marine sediment metagenome]|uniref:Uncharacterized protein n=1 Tax=marine sediment metagenome TaxID=412755 RepID=A0A0F9XG26_9ZZZZ
MIKKKNLVNRLEQLIELTEHLKTEEWASKKYICNHLSGLLDDMLMEVNLDGKLEKEFMKL